MKKINQYYESFIFSMGSLLSSTSVTVVALLIYKLFLDIIYVKYVVMFSSYEVEISVVNISSGWILTGMMGLILPQLYKKEIASNIFIVCLVIVYFVPITTFCGLGGGSSEFLFWAIFYEAAILYIQFKVPVYQITRKESEKGSQIFFYTLITISVIIVVYIVWKYTGGRLATDLFDVYRIREEAEQYNFPQWLSYIFSIIKKLIPIFILYCLYKKKWIIALFLSGVEFMAYSVDAVKSVLFFLVILLIGYIFYRKKMISLILPAFLLLEIGVFLERKCFNSIYLVDLFFRRTLLVPTSLSEQYFHFFQNNPLDIARTTVLGKLGFQSPYSQAIPYVIGNNYSDQIVSANNGLLADVWSTLGVIGIFLFPLILVICLRLLDLATYNLSPRLIVGTCVYYVIAFSNAMWSTVLISHAFVVVCIVYYIFPRNREENRIERI